MAVQAKEVQAVAEEIFNFQKANLAIIGPFKESAKFKKILS
jgi:hypothetical protein